MATRGTSETAAMIEASRAHIARIDRRINETRDQIALARELMAESRRYFELIEGIEADRIRRSADRADSP